MKFKLSKLKQNSINPRKIDNEAIDRLVVKIEKYPKFLSLRPIIYDDETFEILGGNQRFKALKKLGYKEIPNEWVRSASELTDEEKKAFIVIDNINDGKWDFDVLDENFGEIDLDGFGLNDEVFGEEDNSDGKNETKQDIDLSDKVSETFEIIISCEDEIEQEKIFEELTKKGYVCRVLTL
jgi:ParB-like chromosome segregation protein Spo0J